MPVFNELLEIDDTDLNSPDSTDEDEDTDIFKPSGEDCEKPSLFSQSELNDLVRDLYLPKESAELLASRLQEKRLLKPGTSVSFYRNREAELRKYFHSDGQFVYCNDVKELLLIKGNDFIKTLR